jgi:DNA-binding transcriptional ArsR family regulator
VNSSVQLDRSFAALSHPIRRAIVERLVHAPATVGEAARGLPVTKPAISKHVRVLEEARVVRRQVDGRTHQLSLEPESLAQASRWLARHRALWEAKFDVVERHLSEG